MQKVQVELSEYQVEVIARMVARAIPYAKKPSWINTLELIQHELYQQFPYLRERQQDWSSSLAGQLKVD